MSAKENGCAKEDSKESESHTFTLDDLYEKIGHYGRFQFSMFTLLIIISVFHTIVKFNFIFTTSDVVYRCRVPECDDLGGNSYEKQWIEFSIPKKDSGKLDKCQRYMPLNVSSSGDEEYFCNADNFNQDVKISCGDDFIFKDSENTISNEFKIFCDDEWKLPLVGSLWSLGQIFGAPAGGFLADKYGRSTILAICSVSCSIVGIMRSFSPNYYIFFALGLLDNFLGATIYSTAFVLAIESLGPKFRVTACTIIPMCGCFARLILANVAKYFLYWRYIERAVYIPALAFIIYPWILPESFRWLLSQNREEKAIDTIKRNAKWNGRKLSDASIEQIREFQRKGLIGVDAKDKNNFPLLEALKVFHWRVFICSFCWFANNLIFVGLSMYSTLLGDNKYNSFMFSSLVEIPGSIMAALTLDRFGRKFSLSAYFFLSGVFISVTPFISADAQIIHLVLNLLAKMMITASTNAMFVFIAEVFPTNIRNGMLSFCSMIGRFGSIVAPQTPLMAKYYAPAPSILFATCVLLSAASVVFLPETKNTELPSTLKEAEQIGRKNSKDKHEPEDSKA